MSSTLETTRLHLRPLNLGDLDHLVPMYADPEVMRYIGHGATLDRHATERVLSTVEDEWNDRGFGKFALELREDGTFIGWAGLAIPHFLPEVLPAVEIGWRLGREFWGNGYATEAARTVLDFGFRDLKLDRIISIRQLANHRSGQVMTRLGMRVERQATAGGIQLEVREIARTEQTPLGR